MPHLQHFKELVEAIEASNMSSNVLLELVDLGQQPQRLQREILATAPMILICFCVVGLLCLVIMAYSFRVVIRQLSDLHLKESIWVDMEKKAAPGLELKSTSPPASGATETDLDLEPSEEVTMQSMSTKLPEFASFLKMK